ncbi:hypothetical protein BSZ35_00395 [Salinibacter sp. 10B]|nr:hypothetical protein BSZ35_00395 [Salinibacter sp. 10B]
MRRSKSLSSILEEQTYAGPQDRLRFMTSEAERANREKRSAVLHFAFTWYASGPAGQFNSTYSEIDV